MSVDEFNQKLSEFLDDDLSAEESLRLLDRIESSPELQARWRRYHAISAAMKGRKGILADEQFMMKVSTAIKREPTVLVPRPEARKARERLVTLALAASLAFMAILVGKSLHENSPVLGVELSARNESAGSTAVASSDSKFPDYLVMHNETAYLAGAQGILPYARLASMKTGR